MLREIELVINHNPKVSCRFSWGQWRWIKLNVNILWDSWIGWEYQELSFQKIELKVCERTYILRDPWGYAEEKPVLLRNRMRSRSIPALWERRLWTHLRWNKLSKRNQDGILVPKGSVITITITKVLLNKNCPYEYSYHHGSEMDNYPLDVQTAECPAHP